MGLLDIVKKLATGASDEDNRKNKARILVAASWTGFCSVAKEGKMYQLEPITYSPGINRGAKYCVAVTQSSEEVSAFHKFCQAGF